MEFYSINDVSKITGFTTRTLRNYIKSGQLDGEKIDGIWKFTPDDISNFMDDPNVSPGIESKHRALVFDFLSKKNADDAEICVIISDRLSNVEAELVSQKLCGLINSEPEKFSTVNFAFEKKLEKIRIFLTGKFDAVMELIDLYRSKNGTDVLNGLESVRKRPCSYIGSTGINGLHRMVYEAVHNCLDEVKEGYCRNITVTLEKNDVCSVEDDGRGIPIEKHPTEEISILEFILTRLSVPSKTDDANADNTEVLHQVGIACVNALSEWLTVTVKRDGKIFEERFERGIPSKEGLCKIGNTKLNGTVIRWKSDSEIFTETTRYDFDVLQNRFRDIVSMNPGIQITLRDERENPPKEIVLKG